MLTTHASQRVGASRVTGDRRAGNRCSNLVEFANFDVLLVGVLSADVLDVLDVPDVWSGRGASLSESLGVLKRSHQIVHHGIRWVPLGRPRLKGHFEGFWGPGSGQDWRESSPG